MQDFNNIDDLFKDQLHDFGQEAPPKVWEGVKAGISSSGAGRMFWLRGLTVITFISFGAFFTFDQFRPTDAEVLAKLKKEIVFEEGNIDELIALESRNKKDSKAHARHSTLNSSSSKSEYKAPLTAIVYAETRMASANHNPFVHSKKSPPPPINTPSSVFVTMAEFSEEQLVNNEPKEFSSQYTVRKLERRKEINSFININTAVNPTFNKLPDNRLSRKSDNKVREDVFNVKGIHLGGAIHYNNNWIVNQNTYGEFAGYEPAYDITFDYSLGVNAGYDFNTRLGMQVEFQFMAFKGQNYEDLILGNILRKEVRLEYMELPVLIKYKLAKMTRYNPSVTNTIIGIKGSMLKDASIAIWEDQSVSNRFDQTKEVDKRFKKYDVSLVLGLEKDYFITKNLFWTLGFRANIGILDINSESYALSKYQSGRFADPIRSSRNLQFGVIAGINYLIK